MLYIYTALYPEAKPVIHELGLKKLSAGAGFPVYENRSRQIRLILTGTGTVAAAAAVGSTLSLFHAGSKDHLINWGCCAGPGRRGSVYLCNQIIDRVTRHTFYPDMLLCPPHGREQTENRQQPDMVLSRPAGSTDQEQTGSAGLPEKTLITEPQVFTHSSSPAFSEYGSDKYHTSSGIEAAREEGFETDILHDMEAAAIYQSGAYFLSPHQMHFLKVVSDHGNNEPMNSEMLEHIMSLALDKLMTFLSVLQGEAQDSLQICLHEPEEDSLQAEASFDQLCMDFHCSQTMKSALAQHIRYWELSGTDYRSALRQMYQDGKLPCRDRREGKRQLEQFKQCLLYETEANAQDPCLIRPHSHIQPFSHIYVEQEVKHHPRTQKILETLSSAETITISHYKDVFCRKRQDIALQNQSPALILAAKHGNLIYEGAPVCQSFDNEYFYYTSCVMNCLYNCEYCYLKGMYPSGNLVIFVNLEDIFEETEKILQKHPAYICVSYDTDLMALEGLTGFIAEWTDFSNAHSPDISHDGLSQKENPSGICTGHAQLYPLKLEVRTKCGRTDLWGKLSPQKNVIFAFTLSPQEIISRYEHRTSSLADRILCARTAMEQGFSVRLCFDPVIYHPGWQRMYDDMLRQVADQLSLENLADVSVGSFRISQDYMKKLRNVMKHSAAVQFPFENDHGVYRYPDRLMNEMEQFVVNRLKKYIPEEKIFLWNNTGG